MKNHKLKIGVFFILFTCSFFFIVAQKTVPMKIHVSGGIEGYYCTSPDFDFIRADIRTYNMLESTDHISAGGSNKWIGIKSEFTMKNPVYSVSGGVNYNKFNTFFGKNPSWGSSSDFFYLQQHQTDTRIDFLKVKGVSQEAGYLGLNIDVIYTVPYIEDFFWKYFFSAGFEYNFLLYTEKKIQFYKTDMNIYEDEITQLFEKSKSYYTSLHFSAGVKFRENYPLSFSLEMPLSILLTDKSAGFVDPNVGIGLQFSVIYSLHKKTSHNE